MTLSSNMSDPAPPSSVRDSSVKREFSASPDVPQEFGARALHDLDPEEQALIDAIDQELSNGDLINDLAADNTDMRVRTALSNHEEAANEESSGSQHQPELGTMTPPRSAERPSTIFPGIADVSDYTNSDEELSDDGSESLFLPQTPVTPSREDEVGDQSEKSKKKRKSSGPRSKTAREWHKKQHLKLKPHQKRGPAYKRQQLSALRERMKVNARKRKSSKPSPRQKKARVDPSIFLHGSPGARKSTSGDFSDTEPMAVPKDVESSNKTHFWKHFVEQNHGIDMHKSRTDWNQLVKKSTSFGFGQVSLNGKQWELKGMSSKLYHHQLIGVAFMVERECAEEGPFGSICADDMGMGKTVQTLATIVGNPPTKEHISRNEKTTLIIVPSSVRSQWLAEIKKHTPILGENVMQFRSANEDNTITRLKSNDIVLTTYWELFQSLPQPPKWMVEEWRDDKDINEFEKLQDWVETHKHEMGLLHQVNWYRIVLDECHFIKNFLSRTSRAACWLQGPHRLLLSGTPIMNRYQEFHPLFRFLREPVTMNLTPEAFESQYCDETDTHSVEALSIILSDLIVRRTMRDKLFDKPIIELPQDHRDVRIVTMQPAELVLKAAFEVRLKELRTQEFPAGDPRKKLRHRLAQLTRLRQMTANADTISQQLILVFDVDELQALQKKVKQLKVPRHTKAIASILYDRFTIWIREKKNNVYKAAAESEDEAICLKCKDTTEELLIIKCKHTFCESCLEDEVERDMDDETEVMLCPECSKPFKESDKKSYHEIKPSKTASNRQKHAIKRGKDARGFRPTPPPNQLCFSRWLDRIDAESMKILPCAKSVGVIEQVQDWVREAPEDKIIVFTQFRHFQTMVGCMLERKKIDFVYFSGDMTSKQREKAIQMFREQKNIQVMVAGLKCGGLGLNLNFANRVIVSDIWWNSCIDNQAFGRVFRIGQDKETHFVKMVVQETVDERLLLTLQRKKEKAIGEVMQDNLTEDDLDDILGGGDDSFDDFINGLGQDPRFNGNEARAERDGGNDGFEDIDDF